MTKLKSFLAVFLFQNIFVSSEGRSQILKLGIQTLDDQKWLQFWTREIDSLGRLLGDCFRPRLSAR